MMTLSRKRGNRFPQGIIVTGTISTPSGDLQFLPKAGSITKIGIGVPNRLTTPTQNDAFIGGRLEVDDTAYFDGSVTMNSTCVNTVAERNNDNAQSRYGTVNDVVIVFSTGQTPNTLMMGLGVEANSCVICEKADLGVDFAQAIRTDPTFIWQAADASDITKWLSVGYGLIAGGKGDIELAPAEALNINSAQKVKLTTVAGATYTLLVDDYLLHCTYSPTGTCAITLPTAQMVAGRMFRIKDAGGEAGTRNITLSTEGTEKIDGEDTFDVDINYGTYTIYSDGSHWFVAGAY